MRLQSAIFDMDGTLLDSMHVWHNITSRMLQARGIQTEPNLHEKLMVMTSEQGAQYCKDTYHLPYSISEIISMTENEMEKFYRTEVQLKPGVREFLSIMKMEGVWMYIATNTDRRLAEIALKHTGIDQYFRGMLTCSEVGIGKNESPEIYDRAMLRLRSNKRDTVIFEDALHAIRTAKSAGYRVAGVYDASQEADQKEIQEISDYYIHSFEDMFESTSLT